MDPLGIWPAALFVAGFVYLVIFGTMLSEKPTSEKVQRLGWPTLAAFLIYLLLVAGSLWALNFNDAETWFATVALASVFTIPGCISLEGPGRSSCLLLPLRRLR